MFTIHESRRLLRERKISSPELVEEALRRIRAGQPELNAFVTVLEAEARAAAEAAEREMKKGFRGPLHGVPVALKDLFYTKDVLTSAGSGLLADFRPDRDSAVAARLAAAGAVLVGKTNTHEWAFGPTTEDSFYGPTRNPWNPERISGGSSGGSAVAVATGMACMAMGTDTGGSIRVPAALSGVVGFKPTYGLVSLEGVIPLSFSLDHAGPLARSVLDVALTLDALAGPGPNCSPGAARGGLAEAVTGADSLRGVTLGVPENFFFEKTEPAVENLFESAVECLGELGARIVRLEIPLLERVPAVSTIIMFAEAAWIHRERFAERKSGYSHDVQARLRLGGTYSAVEYIEALHERDRIVAAWEEAVAGVDAVLAPTVPVTAYPGGSATIMARGREEKAREMCVRHTRLANVTGGPALSVPCGFAADGLPVGLMFMGGKGQDARVLRCGYAYETYAPFTFRADEH